MNSKPNRVLSLLLLATTTFFCLLMLAACSREAPDPPPPIEQETLIDIITEALIIEPAGREIPHPLQDSVYALHYGRILKHRGHSMEDFVSSMQWLQKDPKRLQEAYGKVLENIQIIESETGS